MATATVAETVRVVAQIVDKGCSSHALGVWRAYRCIQQTPSPSPLVELVLHKRDRRLLTVKYIDGAPDKQRKAFLVVHVQAELTRPEVTAIRTALRVWCPHIKLWTIPSQKLPGRYLGVLYANNQIVLKVPKREDI